MKLPPDSRPQPGMFEATLDLLGVTGAESVMVGDSLPHDVEGARRVGMRGILMRRSLHIVAPEAIDVRVIRALSELPPLLGD